MITIFWCTKNLIEKKNKNNGKNKNKQILNYRKFMQNKNGLNIIIFSKKVALVVKTLTNQFLAQ